ncbi:MAG: hypothetical protein MRY83_24780 [Flavobacteriales bacterium]|nr:hypothetical protein [Flavobacteriales bacterium]
MKNPNRSKLRINITFFILMMFMIYVAKGQDFMVIDQNSASIEAQLMHDNDIKSLKKDWKNYLDNQYDIEINGVGFLKNKDILSTPDDDNSWTMLTNFEKVDEQKAKMTVVVNGLNSNEKKVFGSEKSAVSLQALVKDFVTKSKQEYYSEKIEKAEKHLAKLEKRQAKMSKKNDQMQEQISVNQEEIKTLKEENNELTQDIKALRKDSEELVGEISSSKNRLKSLKSNIK